MLVVVTKSLHLRAWLFSRRETERGLVVSLANFSVDYIAIWLVADSIKQAMVDYVCNMFSLSSSCRRLYLKIGSLLLHTRY